MTRRKRTSIFVLLAAAALLIVGGIAWAQGVFPDVPEDDVHFDNIEWAAENGVVNGFADGTFKPYQNVARAQVATMIRNYDNYIQGLDLGVGGCTECHDDTSLIQGKKTAWEESLHGNGTAFARGTSASCAGCHSGGAFQERIAAGQNPGQVTAGDPDPTRQDCRTCHQIHVTGTAADFALETTEPVALFQVPDTTFDGGDGNLCAECHQPRRIYPGDPDGDGIVTGISEHWGPHHGPAAAMMLGVAGTETGAPMAHYTLIGNTCVDCHMADPRDHTFEPKVVACQPCHAGVTNFDINGTQTEINTRLDAIGAQLVTLGYLSENTENGHPTVTEADVDAAIPLYNWLYLHHEDKSAGVHNPDYARALLDAAEAAIVNAPPAPPVEPPAPE